MFTTTPSHTDAATDRLHCATPSRATVPTPVPAPRTLNRGALAGFTVDPDTGLPNGTLPADVALPITVGLSTYITDTTAVWALLTDTGYLVTGTVTPRRKGGTEGVALLAGVEHLLTAAEFSDRPITVVCASEAFVAQVTPTLAALAPTVHMTHTHAQAGWLPQVAHRYARNVTEPPTQPVSTLPKKWAAKPPMTPTTCLHTPDGRILAATDGSAGNWQGAKVSGYGWIINQDWHGAGEMGGTDILLAELRAVHALLNNVPSETRLHVLVDSQPALAVLDSLRTAPTLTSVTGITLNAATNVWVAALRRQVRYRDVTFGWVKGHSGNPLNDAADRIAVQARRKAQGMTDKTVFKSIVANIAADLAHAIKHEHAQVAAAS